ncbi:MAG: hypothetical protein JXR03_05300 [Cyclobacteriaceae bacterium]
MVKKEPPSEKELEVLQDREFFLIKDSISKKTISCLSEIEQALKVEINQSSSVFPSNAFTQSGKISKGENYRGLPYFVLDYPRLFSKKEVFAFRTMLWWGNEFSCTLHIAGDQLKTIRDNAFETIRQESFYFCVSNSQWEHHFDSSNYTSANELSVNEMRHHMNTNGFIKVSRKISLQEWTAFKSFTLESFARFLQIIN